MNKSAKFNCFKGIKKIEGAGSSESVHFVKIYEKKKKVVEIDAFPFDGLDFLSEPL